MARNRGFAVEIEAAGVPAQSVADALNAAGVATVNRQGSYGWNAAQRDMWQVTYDGSLSRMRMPFELISPVLHGAAGFATLETVANALVAVGATVGKACGLHVHVDANDLDGDALKRLAALFVRYEDEMDRLQPPSRHSNPYCGSNRRAAGGGTDEGATRRAVERIVNAPASRDGVRSVFGMQRYRKLNFEALAKHGTIEWRQAAGTLNARKIKVWVALCLGMVECARRSRGVDSKTQTSWSRLRAKVPAEMRAELDARRRELERAAVRRARAAERERVAREMRRWDGRRADALYRADYAARVNASRENRVLTPEERERVATEAGAAFDAATPRPVVAS